MTGLSYASESRTHVLLADTIKRSPKWARRLILAGYRGSHAHGTYLPPDDPHGTDDVDVFGVYVRGDEYYQGVSGYLRKDDTFTSAGETLDVESHELRKFVWLLMKGNPNVHSHLWLEPQDYFAIHRAGRILIARREGFFSQHVLNSFMGYAYAQIGRMQKFEKRGYMGQKREAIVEQYGYDIKNAAHALRLLYTGWRLLETGRLTIKLTGSDLATVMNVKRGLWKFEEVKERAEHLIQSFDASRLKNEWPAAVPYAFADETAQLVIAAEREDLEAA